MGKGEKEGRREIKNKAEVPLRVLLPFAYLAAVQIVFLLSINNFSGRESSCNSEGSISRKPV